MRRYLPLLLLLGCERCDTGEDSGATDDSVGFSDSGDVDTADTADTADTDDTDTEDTDTTMPDRGSGTLTGVITVQLYDTDAEGDITQVAWADWSSSFVFGAIFVAAYTHDDTTGLTTYLDQQVILSPLILGDTYELTVDLDDAADVYVYAALDYINDGVIGTNDPVGVYAELIALVEDASVSDVDIVINAPIWGWGGSGGGGDDTGGGGGPTIVVSGDVTITDPYTGGNGKVMLYDSAGNGPEYVTSFTPAATSSGAEADWSMLLSPDLGEKRLLGAWDANLNGLIEPTDQWGAYVVSGSSANPLTIGSVDIAGLPVVIPFGMALPITPFVRLEGALQFDDDFATFPAGTTIYVTAVRTRPGLDFAVADLENGYDWASYTGKELVGTSIDFLLLAPSNEVAYLWAFGDVDGDGVLNEVGEPVGSWGRTGRLSTGTTNQVGLDVPIQLVAE